MSWAAYSAMGSVGGAVVSAVLAGAGYHFKQRAFLAIVPLGEKATSLLIEYGLSASAAGIVGPIGVCVVAGAVVGAVLAFGYWYFFTTHQTHQQAPTGNVDIQGGSNNNNTVVSHGTVINLNVNSSSSRVKKESPEAATLTALSTEDGQKNAVTAARSLSLDELESEIARLKKHAKLLAALKKVCVIAKAEKEKENEEEEYKAEEDEEKQEEEKEEAEEEAEADA